MKIPSTTLFDVLKSLSQAEKRYIKINAHTENSDYLQLMNAILKQKTYNESVLKGQFKNKKWVKNFAVTKRYLLELVLKMLERFRKKETVDKVLELVATAKILHLRNLQKTAQKQLLKAQQLAQTNEYFEELLLVLKAKKELLEIAKTDFPTTFEIHEQVENCLTQIQNTHQYWWLNTQLYLWQIRQRGEVDESSDSPEYTMEKLMRNPLLSDISKATNLRSQMYFHQTKAAYFFSTRQPQKALASNQQFLKLLEENPAYLKQFPERYLSTLHNLLIDSLMLHQFDILENGIQKLQQTPKNKAFQKIQNLDSRIFRQRFLLELNYALSTKHFEKGIQLLPELAVGLKKYETQIQPQHSITLQYLAAYLLFKNQQFSEVLDWTVPLLQNTKEIVLPEIFQYARWLNVLAHFELGHEELVLSILPNLKRYLQQRRALFEIEKVLFRYLKKSLEVASKREKLDLKKEVQKEVLKLKEKGGVFFRYLDLGDWI